MYSSRYLDDFQGPLPCSPAASSRSTRTSPSTSTTRWAPWQTRPNRSATLRVAADRDARSAGSNSSPGLPRFGLPMVMAMGPPATRPSRFTVYSPEGVAPHSTVPGSVRSLNVSGSPEPRVTRGLAIGVQSPLGPIHRIGESPYRGEDPVEIAQNGAYPSQYPRS